MSNYIIATHRFLMTVDGVNIPFQEITIPETSLEIISYETGDMLAGTAPMVSPGKEKFGEVTGKTGEFKGNTVLYDWYNVIKTDPTQRKTIIVTLLDETYQPVMSWTIFKTWISKISGASLNAATSAGKEIDITFQCEGYTVEHH